MNRILVTPRSLTASPRDLLAPLEAAGFDLAFSAAGRQPREDELIGLVPGCTGWIAGVEPITERVFAAADRLRVISRNGTGVDSIDLQAAERFGIRVLTADGANARAVAELTVGLILVGLRHVMPSSASLKEGRWGRTEGREISAATIGIIGCGAVGREVARMTCALGAAVLAYDVAPVAAFRPAGGRFAWSGLGELLSQSDVVTLHCPALPDGEALLSGSRLTGLKAGAGIVNTARASLVDEDAVLRLLDEGRVAWLATDVFATEPPPPSALLAHPRVIATPHIGGHTVEGGRAAARLAVDNLIAALNEPQPFRFHGAGVR